MFIRLLGVSPLVFIGIDPAGNVFSLVSVRESSFPWPCQREHAFRGKKADEVVFQAKLDVLGVVIYIYATEFVLWCGVFVSGGYFDLTPSYVRE